MRFTFSIALLLSAAMSYPTHADQQGLGSNGGCHYSITGEQGHCHKLHRTDAYDPSRCHGRTCPNINSCADACYQLYECGDFARDGEGDGRPCEKLCKHRCPPPYPQPSS